MLSQMSMHFLSKNMPFYLMEFQYGNNCVEHIHSIKVDIGMYSQRSSNPGDYFTKSYKLINLILLFKVNVVPCLLSTVNTRMGHCDTFTGVSRK